MLKQKIPAFRQGKHSVRLYAARTRRAQPGTPVLGCRLGRRWTFATGEQRPPTGGVLKDKVKDAMQKKGQKGEPHEKENCHPYRTADPG